MSIWLARDSAQAFCPILTFFIDSRRNLRQAFSLRTEDSAKMIYLPMINVTLEEKPNNQRCKSNRSSESGDVDRLRFDNVCHIENTQVSQWWIGYGNISNEDRRWTMLQSTLNVEDISFVDAANDPWCIELGKFDSTCFSDVARRKEDRG